MAPSRSPPLFFKPTIQHSTLISKSISQLVPPTQFFKRNKSKNRYNVQSLHSIQINRHSAHVNNQKIPRRRLITLPDNNQAHTDRSSRDLFLQKNSSRNLVIKNRYGADRMYTIQNNQSQKNNKIKQNAQLVQNYLKQIKNKSSSKRMLSSINRKSKDKFIPTTHSTLSNSKNIQNNYIKQPLKNNSQAIIIRRCKTKSTIAPENLRISLAPSQIISQLKKSQPKIIKKPQKMCIQNRIKEKPYFQSIKINKKSPGQKQQKQLPLTSLQDIQYSMIDKINQSSFISDIGKQHLRNQFQQIINDNKQVQSQNKLVLKIKNNKKLKNLFPNDFF